MKLITRIAASAAIMVGLSGPALAERENPEELYFGILSTESSSAQREKWGPFLEAMEASLGMPVKPFFAADYAGVIEGMRFNKVHVAWFGNKSAMEAVDRSGGEVFAQTVDAAGNPGYWGHILVHKDSPFNKLADILKCDQSLNFGIGDPNSTSGFLVPTTFIFSAKGIDPKKCFKTVRNANHEANALAVANKLVDAAANNSENLRRIEKNAPDKFKNIRVIWTSPLIPSDPLVWRKDLPEATKKKITDFIFSYGTTDKAEKQVLAGLDWAPFRKSDNNQLLPIRQMEVNKKISKVASDDKMPKTEKTAKIAELQKQFDALGEQISKLSN